jgi:Putative metal-binding motif
MTRAGWSFLGVAVALALGTVAPHAAAKRTGMNIACPNCHEGRDKPQLTVALSSLRVEPGQAVTITITAKHERAKVGGVLVDSNALGAFELVDTVGTRLFDNTTTQATHTMPHPYANGQVQFSFRWIAPVTPGAAVLNIWSNAANDNLKPEDDSPAEVVTGVGVGCDAVWYYLDDDKDGAGAERTKMFSCTPVPDRIVQGGDCDDQKPQVGPSVAEVCNSVDDDCDGVVDDGFTPVLLVTDGDGDGFGSPSGMSMIGCPPVPNFATTFNDCNDLDAAVHPGAVEVANGRDDNCNGKVDDVAAGPANPGTGGSGALTGAAPPSDAGCAFAPPARLQPLHLFGVALLFGWARVRTSRRLRHADSGLAAGLEARRRFIHHHAAALQDGAVDGDADDGADLGHDADERRLPGLVLPMPAPPECGGAARSVVLAALRAPGSPKRRAFARTWGSRRATRVVAPLDSASAPGSD